MNKHLKWILEQYKSQKWFVLIMVVLTLLSSVVSIAFPYVFKEMLDLLKDILQFPAKYPEPMQAVYRIIKFCLPSVWLNLLQAFIPGLGVG